MSKRFVGIDVSLRSFDVAVRPDGLDGKVPYTAEGVAEFVERMSKLRPRLVVLEACGNLERRLARALESGDIPVAVVNPRQVRSALYMSVMAGLRCNQQIRSFYQRLRKQGKPAKVTLVACMRKLLTILNAMIRDHTPWHPQPATP